MSTRREIQVDMNGIRARMNELRQVMGGALRAEIPVLIGNPDSDDDIYVDSNTRTEVYVHDDGDTISGVSIISAANIDKKYLKYGQPIKVKLNDHGAYEFVGIDSQSDSIYSAGNTDSNTQDPVHLSQLDYGTIHPYSGLQVLVKGADYGGSYVDDLISDAFDGTAQDTSMSSITPPTTNNRQIAVLIQMDASTGALEYKQSSEYSAAINRVNAIANSLLPTKDADRFQVGYVFLKAGTATISYDLIWSLPAFITDGGGVDGSTGSTDNALLRADGTGTTTVQATGITVDDSNSMSGATIDADNNTITNIGASEIEAGIITDLTTAGSITETTDYLIVHLSGTGLRKVIARNVYNKPYAIMWDAKSTTTDGGSASATTWNARDLNTEHTDVDSIVTISSNQFTPIAGDYIIEAYAPSFRTNENRLRLYNVTGTASVQEGVSVFSGSATGAGVGATSLAKLSCYFTANGTDAYRIDHYTTTARATFGLGFATGDGSSEIYLVVKLRKVA